ncbi:MAG TPA: prepilin-type N-terminal cleavage/methylation domain-containing protein [Xanthomonadaceae bacterium]|jgi:general secretion pathway protein I|nr:prepilin-type N-terminal cleavage/methylation domain-containing protein [Xanthomonadaceae bacterium]
MRGYTLIEVIVAFAVLALGLTLLLGTLSGSTRQIRWSDDAGRAALHAQSLLDQVGVGEVLQPGHREGELEDGRYRWALDVQPYRRARAAQQPFDIAEPQLMLLTLTVRWGEAPRERLRLQSLRLVAPDPTAGVALP